MLIAVNYHYVRPSFDNPHPGLFGVTSDAFRKQLEMLGQAGEFVGPADVLKAVRGDCCLPPRSILITFDDGLREQYEYAWPILRRSRIPALMFVNTRPVADKIVCTVHKIHLLRSSVAAEELWMLLEKTADGLRLELPADIDGNRVNAQYPFDTTPAARLKYLLNFALSLQDRERLVSACFEAFFGGLEARISEDLYLTPEQIRELGGHDAIGSHSHDHLPLALIGNRACDLSLRRSAELLEEWMGHAPAAVSYPYGTPEAVTPQVVSSAHRNGFEFGFSVEMAGSSDARLRAAPLLLARYDCNYMPGGKLASWTADQLFDSVPSSNWYEHSISGSRGTHVDSTHHV